MRILFDHNVPRRLRKSLVTHEVRTAREMGWSELENGQLLNAAESAGFDVMITCDQNMSYQQNLRGRLLALIVLNTNYWPAMRNDLQPVLLAIISAVPGSFQRVAIQGASSNPQSV